MYKRTDNNQNDGNYENDKINILKEYYKERLNDMQAELIIIAWVLEQIKLFEVNDKD